MMSKLRVLRAMHDMTQDQLAKSAGISRVTVNRIERGNCLPDGHTILRLAAALGCPATEIFPILAAVVKREDVA